MRLFGFYRWWFAIFLVPFSILSQVSDPGGVSFIFLDCFCWFLWLFYFFFKMERAPIKEAVMEIVFETMCVNIRFIFAVGLGLTGANVVTPKNSMGSFCSAAMTCNQVILCLCCQWLIVFRRLFWNLRNVMNSAFVISYRGCFLVVSK